MIGVALLSGDLGVVLAQEVAYLNSAPTPAHELSRKALECLRRGEDATTNESKLAAYREGLQYAEQAIAQDDADADAHFARFANRGRILLLEGGTPNPFNLLTIGRDLDRALELNPNHADALAAKGGLYRQLPRLLGGSTSKAEECLNRAIAIEPDRAVGARVELAQLYRDRGEPERGIPLLRAAISIAERDGKKRQQAEAANLLNQLTGEIKPGK
ncbi:MAG TPA: TRAP transporter TatT component family protein [Candidatus Acidoferrales bacterium]|nr:TRAP transporter TatT component family protein [Candidatus Acidoferrales bacterium]